MKKIRPILLAEDSPADAEMAIDALREANLANPIVHVEDGVEVLDFLYRRNAHAGHAHSTAWPIQAGSPRRQPQVTAFIGGTPASASSATVASAIGPATPTKIGSARRSERRTSCRTSRVRSRRTAMRVVVRMAIPGGWRRRV